MLAPLRHLGIGSPQPAQVGFQTSPPQKGPTTAFIFDTADLQGPQTTQVAEGLQQY